MNANLLLTGPRNDIPPLPYLVPLDRAPRAHHDVAGGRYPGLLAGQQIFHHDGCGAVHASTVAVPAARGHRARW